MPDLEEHCKRTMNRYMVEGREIHSWLDDPSKKYASGHRQFRHDTETVKLVGQLFGKTYGRATAENIALDHIMVDHEEEIKNRNLGSSEDIIQLPSSTHPCIVCEKEVSNNPFEKHRCKGGVYRYNNLRLLTCPYCKQRVPDEHETHNCNGRRRWNPLVGPWCGDPRDAPLKLTPTGAEKKVIAQEQQTRSTAAFGMLVTLCAFMYSLARLVLDQNFLWFWPGLLFATLSWLLYWKATGANTKEMARRYRGPKGS
jgi:hypothetical protein